ncbi:Gene Transfer Agent (GTA) ORFG10 [hydrothermal vent metagenome]|uniref:Gene Transfer Agent (GTA) ORFG10 n=1 Tax=hydrothermal vent metagenome TaxID=652676 RepID=A0A3B0STL0_9ZZZZ
MTCNQIRGEVLLHINQTPYRLCLTLGALAEIESAFGLSELSDLSKRLQKISANDVLILLAALLKGGANPLSPSELMQAKTDPNEVAKAIAQAFAFSDPIP